jgi:hypothetical protein
MVLSAMRQQAQVCQDGDKKVRQWGTEIASRINIKNESVLFFLQFALLLTQYYLATK